MTSPDMTQYGLIACSRCEGNGYRSSNVGSSPCTSCQGTGKILSWWPDAFSSLIVLNGPLLQSTDDTLDEGRDPGRVEWTNGCVAWKHVTHLSQFTIVHHLTCRVPDGITADGKPKTWQMRHSPSGMALETTKVHLPNDYVIVGLPYPLVQAAWLRYLARPS